MFVKHDIEQNVVNINPETLHKNIKKEWMLVFQEVEDIFSVCYEAVL